MWSRIKQYLLVAAGLFALHFLLSHHIIFDQSTENWFNFKVYTLQKSSLNLHYTFYSITRKKPESILKIDVLREDGIGELLVDIGRLTEEQRARLENKYRYD